jgi:gamma-glutamylcyclotransferase (GGCT)/AIG2-like uncharacterized protein YtfP
MKLFVYGTLKRGFYNHRLLKDSQFLGYATTKEKFPLTKALFGLPVMLPFQGYGHLIRGEVYEVNTQLLKAIDEVEGHPSTHKRELITVIGDVARKEIKFVSTYFYQELTLTDVDEKDLISEYQQNIGVQELFQTID